MFKVLDRNAIICYVFLMIVINGIFFHTYLMQMNWLITGFAVVVFYFMMFDHFSKKWMHVNSNHFKMRIFRTSLFVNVISVIFLFACFYIYGDTPFEPNASDSMIYHEHGIGLAKRFRNLNFDVSNYLYENDYSDYGYNVFLGFIYALFGPYTFVAHLANAFIGALSVLTIYKTSLMLFEEKIAKTAAILMTFFPFFLFFISVNLKETVMIFVLLQATYFSVKIHFEEKKKLTNVFYLAFFMILLFFFRTVLGMAFFLSFIYFFYLNLNVKTKVYRLVAMLGVVLLIAVVLFLVDKLGFAEHIQRTIDQSSSQTDAELSDKISRGPGSGLSVKKAIVAPLLFLSVLMAPFTTFVFLDDQVQIAWLFSGALVKNIMIFFAIFGMWHAFRNFNRRASLLISFVMMYLVVLAVSAESTSSRFQLVILPFLCVFMSIGLHNYQTKWRPAWNIYLFLMFFIIIVWNYFKLSIRNLV